MNANKALWEKGDFSQIAATMRTSGERFVEQLGITPGVHVLDLGCGDGTTAVPAAQLGADVLGVDIASNLVAAGKIRDCDRRRVRFKRRVLAYPPEREGEVDKYAHLSEGAPPRSETPEEEAVSSVFRSSRWRRRSRPYTPTASGCFLRRKKAVQKRLR